MLIDLLTSTMSWRSTQVKLRSHQLTSDLKRCLLFRKCLRWSSRKAVSVPTSVSRRPGGSQRLAILCVYVCMCVCVCVCVCVYVCVCVCHRGIYEGLSMQMSACGYLCASCRRFLYIGLHVKPRLHAWHSHRQSRSHFALSSLSDQGEIRLFFIFRNSFLYKITVSFTMVIKKAPGGPCRWRAVNFEIHLWISGMNADCIWRSICIQHVQIEAGLNSDPGNDSFWDKSATLSMLIDLLTIVHVDQRRWRSHQLTSDLQGCLLFLKCLRWSSRKAVSVPLSVVGGLGAP